MVANISAQLDRLRARRHGTDRLDLLPQEARDFVAGKRLLHESWESRASGKPFTRYALGAMQAVDPDYTRISLETAKRVENQLETRLIKSGLTVNFRLQGSVPLDVHIRGVSDVDLLVLDTSFLVYAIAGQRSNTGFYIRSEATSLGVLLRLRQEIERALPEAFYAATVDTTGSKAVKISGGSLARSVDVVPSHWWDTVEYQRSGQEYDRGVQILDKKTYETLGNLPFLHIKRVEDRCDSLGGGLRKAIRLCKNIKADAAEDGRKIGLSSFDIASAMYHADENSLRLGYVYELAILAETQRHLARLANDHAFAQTLRVPDNSRYIFDEPSKLLAVTQLSREMDELMRQVASEQRLPVGFGGASTLEQDRTLLKASAIF